MNHLREQWREASRERLNGDQEFLDREAELERAIPGSQSMLTNERARVLATQILDENNVDYKRLLIGVFGTSPGLAAQVRWVGSNSIHITFGADRFMTRWNVCHECAHVIAGFDDGHGSEFQRVFSGLLARYFPGHRLLARRQVYWHGTHASLPIGTQLHPSSAGSVGQNWGYGERGRLRGRDEFVWVSRTPEQAFGWAAMGGMFGDSRSDPKVYAVEVTGPVYSANGFDDGTWDPRPGAPYNARWFPDFYTTGARVIAGPWGWDSHDKKFADALSYMTNELSGTSDDVPPSSWGDPRSRGPLGSKAAGRDPRVIPNLKPQDAKRRMSEREAESKALKVIKAIGAHMGVDLSDVTIDFNGGVETARFVDYSTRDSFRSSDRIILCNPYMVLERAQDPELGQDMFRVLSHEAVHATSGAKWTYPGVSHDLEEAGAEIISVTHWGQFGPTLDHRDAIHNEHRGQPDNPYGDVKWIEGIDALVRGSVYKKQVGEFIRRAASKVGWDPRKVEAEVIRVYKLDDGPRRDWAEGANPEFPLPSGVYGEDGPLLWLVKGLLK